MLPGLFVSAMLVVAPMPQGQTAGQPGLQPLGAITLAQAPRNRGSRGRRNAVSGPRSVRSPRVVRIRPARRISPPRALDETETERLKRSDELIERQRLPGSICQKC